jgi:5-hydroxyisourate hydrolase-like protein (transthyretin family)
MSISVEVIDGVHGGGAAELPVRLLREVDGEWVSAGGGSTNDGGAIPEVPSPARGRYQLEFDLDRYYSALGVEPAVSCARVLLRVFHPRDHARIIVIITPAAVLACRHGMN